MFDSLLQSRRRLHRYQVIRARLEAMSDAELADAGMKRYQLGAVARVEALRR